MTATDATLLGSGHEARGPRVPGAPGIVVVLAELVRLRIREALRVVTTAGWLVLGVGVVSVTVGAIAGWVEFVVLGTAFLAALVGCALFLIGRTSYAVDLDVVPARRRVGEPDADVSVRIVNSSARRLLASRADVLRSDGPAEEVDIPGLRPGASAPPVAFAIPTTRRGVIRVGPVLFVRGDPLGLLRRTIAGGEPREFLVHPDHVRIRPRILGRPRDLEGRATAFVTPDDLTFQSLRPYVPGDDQRHIHWRSSARGLSSGRDDAYQVRQFEESRRSQITLLLPEDASAYADADEFELAVSLLASIGLQAITSGAATTGVTERRTLRSGSTHAFLDDTARLEMRPDRRGGIRSLLHRGVRRAVQPDVLVLVTGARTTASDVREAGRRAPASTSVVVLRARLGAEPTVSRVGAVLELGVGALGELPNALRRAGLT